MHARTARTAVTTLALLTFGVLTLAAPALADQVIADDQIVQGSTCTGFDCVNLQTFLADSVMELKENNTRIGFTDTSTGLEPAIRWEVTANDSASGGLNYLQILQTSGGGGAAFRVLSGTGTDALAARAGGTVVARGSIDTRVDGTSTSVPGAAPANVLDGLASITIDTGVSNADPSGGRHVRVDAASLLSTYGIGDGTTVSIGDLVGLALAASGQLATDVAAATPGATGPQGLRGDAGPAGPAGRDGRDGTTDPDADEELRRRIARLSAQQANLTTSTTVLNLRLSAVRRGVQRLAD